MSDTVKLIIEIHKEQYDFIKQGMPIDKVVKYPALMEAICEHITHGVPLDDVKAEINSEIPKVRELFDIAYEYNKKDSTRTELSQKSTTYLLDVWQTMGAIVDSIGEGVIE